MNERLAKLCLLPPSTNVQFPARSTESSYCAIRRQDGQIVKIDVPLFWYNPPWHQISADAADLIAVAVGQLGVLVSALRRDLAGPDRAPAFHDGGTVEHEDSNEAAIDATPLGRIVPYRPERYGISDRDFDGPRIIDVRLTMSRDESGRFVFAPEQIERWEATPASAPLAGGSWVRAATFPFDVVSLKQLSSKLSQLRALAPTAAVFVSMGPYRIDEELPEFVAARPDGLILRLDELDLDGLQLATITQRVRQRLDRADAADLPLWIVPGEVTADDVVKLIALGAAGVAIDSWCAELVKEGQTQLQSSAARGYSMRNKMGEAELIEWVEEELATPVERVKGLLDSIQCLPPSERLASLSDAWANELGIPKLSLSGRSTPEIEKVDKAHMR